MKNLEDLPVGLFDLIAEKDFSALTAAERQLVQANITPEEYQEFRGVIKDFHLLDVAMSTASKNNKNSNSTESKIKRIMTHPVPLYQVAAVLIGLVIVTFSFSGNDLDKKEVTPVRATTLGKSLAQDAYPDSLVFNF